MSKLYRGIGLSLIFFVCVPFVQSQSFAFPAHAIRSKVKRTVSKKSRSKKRSLMFLVYRVRLGKVTVQRYYSRLIRKQHILRALPYLQGLVRMKKPIARRGGAIALGELGLPWTIPCLFPLLQDPSLEVRHFAYEALTKLAQVPGLSTQYQQSLMVKMFALALGRGEKATIGGLRVLSALGRVGALPLLKKQKRFARGKVRPYYTLTLATLGDKMARKRWRRAFGRNPGWAGPFLGRWPGAWGRRVLLEALATSSLRKRTLIARWLRLYRDKKRAAALKDACSKRLLGPQACRKVRIFSSKGAMRIWKVPQPLYLMQDKDIQKALKALHTRYPSFYKRLERVGRRMLGTPYQLDALGEGSSGLIDKDPTFTLKRMDCVTFLEEKLSLVRLANLSKAKAYTQQLRYFGGKIQYRDRRHLPMAQWIPSLIRKGFFEEYTRKVGGKKTRLLRKHITFGSYATRAGRRFMRRLGRKNVVTGHFSIPYLTLQTALANMHKIPSGTVMSIMRPLSRYSPGQIFHQGMVVEIGGKLYFRHASRLWRSLVDTPLHWYLKSLIRYPRPVLGVHLLRVKPAGKTASIR